MKMTNYQKTWSNRYNDYRSYCYVNLASSLAKNRRTWNIPNLVVPSSGVSVPFIHDHIKVLSIDLRPLFCGENLIRVELSLQNLANRLHYNQNFGVAKRVACLDVSLFFNGWDTLLTRPAGSARSLQDNQSMREGQHLVLTLGARSKESISAERDKVFVFTHSKEPVILLKIKPTFNAVTRSKLF